LFLQVLALLLRPLLLQPSERDGALLHQLQHAARQAQRLEEAKVNG
jgi:hypothetical protein